MPDGLNPFNATDVRINQTINVTLTEDMDQLTITNSNFMLIGPGAAAITGTVTYVATNKIATFTPTTNLAADSTFTNTLTAGVKDLAGNALATNFVWSFTTGTQAYQSPINLGATSPFAIMATAAISGGGSGAVTVQASTITAPAP